MIKPLPIPATNPSGSLIGYANLLTSSTTADAEVMLIPNTWERYRPAAGLITVKFQMSSAADVDFIALAAHSFQGNDLLIQTAATIGGALTDVELFVPGDDSPLMAVFETRTIQEVAITSTVVLGDEYGVIYAGKLLQMPRNIYGGHSPIALSQKTTYQSNKSESGQILGRNIKRQGQSAAFRWQFLDPDWYRENFQPFVQSATIKPFFIAWRPDLYSHEIAFGEVNEDITPNNSGGGSRLMDVGFTVVAHSDV